MMQTQELRPLSEFAQGFSAGFIGRGKTTCNFLKRCCCLNKNDGNVQGDEEAPILAVARQVNTCVGRTGEFLGFSALAICAPLIITAGFWIAGGVLITDNDEKAKAEAKELFIAAGVIHGLFLMIVMCQCL